MNLSHYSPLAQLWIIAMASKALKHTRRDFVWTRAHGALGLKAWDIRLDWSPMRYASRPGGDRWGHRPSGSR